MQNIAASLWLTGSLFLYWRSWQFIQGTTLETAWRWGWSAGVLWGIAWLTEFFPGVAAPGIVDQAWYAVGLLFLAALISILGAKRPNSRVWTWFVTVPMLLVLGWPALFAWFNGWPPPPLRLMSPALCALTLVCVMGLGNYVGTRFLMPALCMSVAFFWLLTPFAGWPPGSMPSAHYCRLWATVCLCLAVTWPALFARSEIELPQTGQSAEQLSARAWDRVWVDFVNAFGIVWGRRLQDRFNETSRRLKWGVQLDFYGLTWDATQQVQPGSDRAALPCWTVEMTDALEWLLRRFVDRRWLERRVGRLAESRETPDATGEHPTV